MKMRGHTPVRDIIIHIALFQYRLNIYYVIIIINNLFRSTRKQPSHSIIVFILYYCLESVVFLPRCKYKYFQVSEI